jgi:hypothetical protein
MMNTAEKEEVIGAIKAVKGRIKKALDYITADVAEKMRSQRVSSVAIRQKVDGKMCSVLALGNSVITNQHFKIVKGRRYSVTITEIIEENKND